MHLNPTPLRNAGIPHGIAFKRARIFMYLENCIQRKDTISLTQKIQDIREKTYRPFDRVIETEDASSAKADTPEEPTLITLYGRKNWLS